MRIAVALDHAPAGASAAKAQTCGPGKLGTSRVVEVGAHGGLEVGLKTYPQTIPLADHEVILTFDDGPAAKTTPEILNALAEECVRATFFDIGRNVEGLPEIARREALDGHNVAHHTWSHPQPTLRYMPEAAARADILKGMIAVEKAAYGQTFPEGEPKDLKDLKLHTPWFRFPGFADTQDLRDWFAANNVGIFGVDLWASDWIKMTPEQELQSGDEPARPARQGHAPPARQPPMDRRHGSDASQRTESEGLQDRADGSRPRNGPDRARAEGLDFGDGAGDRRRCGRG